MIASSLESKSVTMKVLLPGLVLVLAPLAGAQSPAGIPFPAGASNRTQLIRVASQDSVQSLPNAALGQPVISATSESDAINAAAQRLRERGGGALFVRTESGLGMVAVGKGAKGDAEGVTNETLRAMLERRARTEAYLDAKARIATLLSDVKVEGRVELMKQKHLLDDDKGSAANTGTNEETTLKEVVSAFLRGAVLYDITTDAASGGVLATVISTPRSQGEVAIEDASALTHSTIEGAKDLVVREVMTGVVPPLGGRVLTIVSQKQIAWIAWGCAYVSSNPDPKLAEATRKAAEAESRQLAEVALLAVMKGETVEIDKRSGDAFRDWRNQFEKPLRDSADSKVTRFASARRDLVHTLEQSEAMRTVAAGTLPRGFVCDPPKTSEDGRWVYTIAFYAPGDSSRIFDERFASLLRDNPLGDSARRANAYEVKPDGSFKIEADGRLVPKAIPSGRVSNPDDL